MGSKICGMMINDIVVFKMNDLGLQNVMGCDVPSLFSSISITLNLQKNNKKQMLRAFMAFHMIDAEAKTASATGIGDGFCRYMTTLSQESVSGMFYCSHLKPQWNPQVKKL